MDTNNRHGGNGNCYTPNASNYLIQRMLQTQDENGNDYKPSTDIFSVIRPHYFSPIIIQRNSQLVPSTNLVAHQSSGDLEEEKINARGKDGDKDNERGGTGDGKGGMAM